MGKNGISLQNPIFYYDKCECDDIAIVCLTLKVLKCM
ncbi:hypothetical protein Tsp_01591 [Trichinella spiralis]|nr:hypothetical protein Tsp_01591 [Trichinella spiralis]